MGTVALWHYGTVALWHCGTRGSAMRALFFSSPSFGTDIDLTLLRLFLLETCASLQIGVYSRATRPV